MVKIFAALKEDPSLHSRVLRMVQPITPVLGDLMFSIASMGIRHAHDIKTHTGKHTNKIKINISFKNHAHTHMLSHVCMCARMCVCVCVHMCMVGRWLKEQSAFQASLKT